jgi:sulfonate transport system permease protein
MVKDTYLEEEKVSEKKLSKIASINWKIDKSSFVRVCSIVLFFVVWQVIYAINVKYELFNVTFLPSPIDVCKTTIDSIKNDGLLYQIYISMVRALLGFLMGTVFAVLLGVLICRFQIIDDLISPILNLVGPIPVYAFLPIFIIWFGIGEFSKVSLIAYATFMPLLTYTIDGIRGVNSKWIRSALSLGASEYQVFSKVIFKAALPNIFVGMHVSLALTFSALVVAEMMGATKGLGYIIVYARNWFKMGDMFMAVIIIGLLYLLFNFVLTLIEKRLFRWKGNGLKNSVEK